MRAIQVLAVAADGQVVPARAQMATTPGFHIILAYFRIAFPTIILVAEYRRLRRSDNVTLLLARRWPQVLGVLVAVGADGVFATTKPGLPYIDMSTLFARTTAKRVAAAGHTAASECLTSRSAATSREPSKGRSRSWWAETPHGRRPPRSDRRSSTSARPEPVRPSRPRTSSSPPATSSSSPRLWCSSRRTPISTDATFNALGDGLAGSAILDRKAPDMLARRFDPGSAAACATGISVS